MTNLYLIGFAQALFFTALILTKREKKLSDYLLGFFFLLLGSQLFFIYSYLDNILTQLPIIIYADIYYWTFLGPTLFLYTIMLSSPKQKPKKIHLLCLLPAVIVTIGFGKFIFYDINKFLSDTAEETWLVAITKYVWYYNSILFVTLSILYLRKHSRRVKEYYSYTKNVDLKWLYFLNIGFGLFLLVMIITPYLKILFNFGLPSSLNYTWLVMVIYIFGLGFYGYKQRGIFENENQHPNDVMQEENSIQNLAAGVFTLTETNKRPSYEKSGLNPDEAKKILCDLEKLMRDEKIFLNYELDLTHLAGKLKTTTHKLSQVINEKTGKNFFEYVNGYRVEELKIKLADPAQNKFKILTLAYECGFNSKSTFYTFFKNHTSQTPANFRQTAQKKAV